MASGRGRWMIGAAVLGTLLAVPTRAESTKISADLRERLRGSAGEQRVIVTYAAGASAAARA